MTETNAVPPLIADTVADTSNGPKTGPPERPARLSQCVDVLFRPHWPQDIPNIITVIRLTLTTLVMPPMCAAFLLWDAQWAIWTLFALAIALSLTDWLDGFLARKYGWTSVFGAWLDPKSDKIFTLVCWLILIAITAMRETTAELAVMIGVVVATVAREHYVDWLRTRFVFPANIYGKIKTTLQMLAIVAFLMLYLSAFAEIAGGIKMAAWALLGAQLVMAWQSAIYYRLSVKGYRIAGADGHPTTPTGEKS